MGKIASRIQGFGNVHIYEGIPPEGRFASFTYIQDPIEREEKSYPHSFEATAYISTDTFNYLLNLDDEHAIIELYLEFDPINGNIKWDGDDKHWDLTNNKSICPFEVADEVEIRTSVNKQEA